MICGQGSTRILCSPDSGPAREVSIVSVQAGQPTRTEPNAGTWKTWVIPSGQQFRVPPPPDKATTDNELAELVQMAAKRDQTTLDQIGYWDIGSPSSLGTPERFAAYAARIKQHAREAGRDFVSLNFAYSAGWYNEHEAERLPDGSRRSFTGTPSQIADDIKRYAEVGVRHMMFPIVVRRPGVTVQQSLERMEHFATKITPLVYGLM